MASFLSSTIEVIPRREENELVFYVWPSHGEDLIDMSDVAQPTLERRMKMSFKVKLTLTERIKMSDGTQPTLKRRTKMSD